MTEISVSGQSIIMTKKYQVNKMDFVTAGEASSAIRNVLLQVGVESHIVRAISIATYEAEMNIVIHSEGGEILLFVEPDKIRVIAKDHGPGIENIDLAMQEGYSTAPAHVREMGFGAGMGLPNIKRSSNEFRIYSEVGKGTELEMGFHL